MPCDWLLLTSTLFPGPRRNLHLPCGALWLLLTSTLFAAPGIVGRINPVIWQALQAAMVATASNDFDMLARALATVGATSTDVDISVRCQVMTAWTP